MAVHIVGSINLDIITSLDHLPLPGETVMAKATARLPGGKGANQAVAAARMGAQTRMVGAVGNDDAGRWMRERLARDGIAVSGVVALEGVETGTAYIAVDAEGENQIVVVSGANARLTPPGPVNEGVLLAQLEVPVGALLPVFRNSKCIRILNAAPAVLAADVLLDHVDVLVVNQTELAAFACCGPVDALPAVVREARSLIRHEDQAVVVTLGARGSVAVKKHWDIHVPAVPVIPVDTVGAGDSFCGALAALLDEGRSLAEALPWASAAAALCTLGQGAAPSMPMRAAVADLLSGAATEHAPPIKNRAGVALG
ncbi:ribokinase [Novosphingobium clariflavum]|uniref:Ribokinase n=1 Tax=Novosphingobium clariflavum TaxID=2029884 RepID=A0ABV6SEP7_9SPHN|nr:ribokinase [Novosphingobium clariflavum]